MGNQSNFFNLSLNEAVLNKKLVENSNTCYVEKLLVCYLRDTALCLQKMRYFSSRLKCASLNC